MLSASMTIRRTSGTGPGHYVSCNGGRGLDTIRCHGAHIPGTDRYWVECVAQDGGPMALLGMESVFGTDLPARPEVRPTMVAAL